MMFSAIWVLSSTLSLLLVGAGLLGAKADETKIVVDFSTDASLNPPDAWFSENDNSCQNVDYYTAQINATASLTFTGDRIQISGLRNNQSGIFRVSVDDEQPYEGDLYSGEVDCTLFVDFFLHNGTHNITIELLGKSINASEGAITPVLHLTNIVYFVPGLPANNTSSSTPATGSLRSNTNSSSLYLAPLPHRQAA